MKAKNTSNKVIALNRNVSSGKRASLQRKNAKRSPNMRVIAITSGKGGVGKTNIVANLGFALSQLEKKVLILDADLGLGNIDVLLGIAPKYNLSHVFMGIKTIQEIMVEGPGNVKILPASSGIQELAHLTKDQKLRILEELDSLSESTDVLLIDTAAGISSNVMYFNVSAQEIMVVVTPEPTSITDAYALMKVLSLKYSENKFKLVVNLAADSAEAQKVYRQLSLVADRFLDISIEYFGYILFDKSVSKGVMRQKVVSDIYPDAQASRCFADLAKRISVSPPPRLPNRDPSFMWKHLLQYKFD